MTPGATEAVGDQDRRRRAGQLAQPRTQLAGRGVWIARQQDQRLAGSGLAGRGLAAGGGWRVGGVDTGVGADEAVMGATDQDAARGAQDLARLVEHDLHGAGVLALRGGDLARARRRLHPGELYHGPLGLGHGLVRDRDHLAVAQRTSRRAGVHVPRDQRGEIVAGTDLRQAGEAARG